MENFPDSSRDTGHSRYILMITYWWAGTLFANRLQRSRCSWWDGRTKRTVASFKSWSLGVDWSSQNSWWSAHWRSNCGLSIDHGNFCGDVQIVASVSARDIARNDTSQVSAPIESAEKYAKLDEKVTEKILEFSYLKVSSGTPGTSSPFSVPLGMNELPKIVGFFRFPCWPGMGTLYFWTSEIRRSTREWNLKIGK